MAKNGLDKLEFLTKKSSTIFAILNTGDFEISESQ